jgi:hypothetical protein
VTIPNGDGAPLTAEGIRNVVSTYERSTTGPDENRLQNTKRMARWSRRLAAYLLRVAGEIDRLHRLLEEQGRTISLLREEKRP